MNNSDFNELLYKGKDVRAKIDKLMVQLLADALYSGGTALKL